MVSFHKPQFTVTLLYKYVRGCVSLKKQKSFSRQSCTVYGNSKEENSRGFCLDFVQEFGLCGPSGCNVNVSLTDASPNGFSWILRPLYTYYIIPWMKRHLDNMYQVSCTQYHVNVSSKTYLYDETIYNSCARARFARCTYLRHIILALNTVVLRK